MKIRYIKDYLRGHTDNSMNSDWTEIKAIDYQGNNIALGKVVTASSTPSWGTLDRVTDGVIEGEVSVGIASDNKQWVQVDLGDIYHIDYLHIWHYFASSRTFNDTKVEVSEDGINWVVVFDSSIEGTYAESSEGRKFTLPYSVDLDELPMSASLNQIKSKVSNIKDEINTIKNVFKNNLIAKGVECSEDDKMSSLIDKVNGISTRKYGCGFFKTVYSIPKTTYGTGTNIASTYTVDSKDEYVDCAKITFTNYRGTDMSGSSWDTYVYVKLNGETIASSMTTYDNRKLSDTVLICLKRGDIIRVETYSQSNYYCAMEFTVSFGYISEDLAD